ncbi:conserved protein of unknown function [Pseudodesulfovibrio profundus]|uniref:Polysaccharide biosynthesis enzyme WcbI domain-containing protein n=2 Tax=Pseudodesulfovibrio profundus TaxID=57320 RepID=A0A2C8FA94_9BACT|nr:conserved protein of unknown function [Pseudodesulfovibrio profundus]
MGMGIRGTSLIASKSGYFNRFRDIMNKRLCILHANCQGEPLLARLNASPEFTDQYECRIITNYTREAIPDGLLERCDLFLYQYLNANWGELASDTLLGKLKTDCKSLCIPNMFFAGYWPFWNGKPGFNYRCTHLDDIINMGLPDEETVLLYLRSNLSQKFDLNALLHQTIAQEQQREAHTPIKYVDIIENEHGQHRLFNTVNHPNARLMDHAATEVLRHLGMTPPDRAVLDALGDPFPEFEQPINPHIAAHFGWPFGGADAQYNVYGIPMSHARYVANYVSCQKAGIEDFIGYLQGEYRES